MITIHRALSELKVIDSRIDKLVSTIEPSGSMLVGKRVNNFYQFDDFNADVKAKFTSINDLIKRKGELKSAITKANSSTMVTIGGKTMTISDAINFKTVVGKQKMFIDQLRRKHLQMKGAIDKQNALVESKAIEIAIGSDGNEAVSITKPYIEANSYILVDPLNIEKKIEEMELDVYNFETDVDAVLSEINAITSIEI